ncbi:hypothetical protein [Thioclava sp. GXIMD4215]|uniref:hypothetical protein n=1 Tax=Thioclava sp. GXIMD4215 TaxID=3131928 RepID=UPI0032532D73
MQVAYTFVCLDASGNRYTVQAWRARVMRTLPSGRDLCVGGPVKYTLEDGTKVIQKADGAYLVERVPTIEIFRDRRAV